MSISIIIPIHNGAKTIERCIERIMSQDYPNIQVILVEDQSDDNSYEICQKLAEKFRNIEIFQTNKTRGVSAARNIGLLHASGEIIGFCDADDYYEEGTIAYVMDYFSNHLDVDILIGGFNEVSSKTTRIQKIKKDKKIYGEDGIGYVLLDYRIMGSVWNKFYRRKILRDIQFDQSLSYCEDMHFNIRILDENRKSVCYISSNIFYNYVTNMDSVTHRYEMLYDEENNLKYINSTDRIEKDCRLDKKEKRYLRCSRYKLALGDFRNKHQTQVQKSKLYDYIKNNWCIFALNIFKYGGIKRNIKDLVKGIIIIICWGKICK